MSSVMKPAKTITITIDGKIINLERGTRISCGRNELSDIKWYVYKTDEKDLGCFPNGYDGVAAMYTKITEDILNKIKNDNILNTGVSRATRINVDMNTGNIHPPKENVQDSGYGEIKQLVLFRGRGPLAPQFINTKDYYVYSAVHKACYYPLISNNDEDKYINDERHKFLEKVWKSLKESNKVKA